MQILMINKFLFRNGGSETYIFKLGEQLQKMGHEVQFFGMEHEGRCVGNRVNAYTSDMDFHGGSKLSKLTYPIKKGSGRLPAGCLSPEQLQLSADTFHHPGNREVAQGDRKRL